MILLWFLNAGRYRLVEAEPKRYENVAGIVYKLANDYNIAVPNWGHKDEYKLNEPYYLENKEVSPYFKLGFNVSKPSQLVFCNEKNQF